MRPGDMLMIGYGRVGYEDPTLVDQCYLCGGAAKAWPYTDGPEGHPPMAHGAALINKETTVPLCEMCFGAPDRDMQMPRKVMGSPDMDVQEGGAASAEHIIEVADAIREREQASSH
jgi:hypothetical protein